MTKLIILGSSNAIPDEKHENTHMVIVSNKRAILIDCGNSPTLRLRQVGVALEELTDIILTHFHPDHVSGFPTLIMNMWLLGRKAPLDIYGLQHTLDRVNRMMDAFDWNNWPKFFPVHFHYLQEGEMTPVLATDEIKIYSTPVSHLIPNIGLRIEHLSNQAVVAYSCDTAPCPSVVNLATGANILIHEAAGEILGHTSASQAGEIAAQAGVKRLYLIHYPTGDFDSQSLIPQAQTTFSGEVALAKDFMEIPF
ncbi:MAG: MBL fold metallo-hydrolase [Anaerolineales bacterium]|nr:MBL fold metallo-hydrolase [Anaerolineales bacterium]